MTITSKPTRYDLLSLPQLAHAVLRGDLTRAQLEQELERRRLLDRPRRWPSRPRPGLDRRVLEVVRGQRPMPLRTLRVSVPGVEPYMVLAALIVAQVPNIFPSLHGALAEPERLSRAGARLADGLQRMVEHPVDHSRSEWLSYDAAREALLSLDVPRRLVENWLHVARGRS
jgi:hypothetical protein